MLTVERHTQNLTILASLKNNTATPDMLKRYTGWGGMRQSLFTPAIYGELKKILTLDEITSLKQTLSSAYYTPCALVRFMYDWLLAYGFKGGSVLEPALGHGVFIEHMPSSLRHHSQITAVEIDQISSQIARNLYPDVTVWTQGFETWQPEQKFDLVIGNPPYGSQKLSDSQHQDLKNFCIHHYFVAKGMRLLKPEGLLAMVLPSYFLDNGTAHVREIIAHEGGSLLAAYRLPDDLFQDAKVTVDLVFLKKGDTGKAWVKTKSLSIGGKSQSLNEYYHLHPEHILGNLEIVPMYERVGLTCKRTGNPFSLLQKTLKALIQEKLAFVAEERDRIEERSKALQVSFFHLFDQLRGVERTLGDSR